MRGYQRERESARTEMRTHIPLHFFLFFRSFCFSIPTGSCFASEWALESSFKGMFYAICIWKYCEYNSLMDWSGKTEGGHPPTAQSLWHLFSTKALSLRSCWGLPLEEGGDCPGWGLWFKSQKMVLHSKMGHWLHLWTWVSHFPL